MMPVFPPARFPLPVTAILVPALAAPLAGQNHIGSGEAAELYQRHCAVCHGRDLQGGLGASLIDGEWKHARTDDEIATVIREGMPELGMMPFESTLSEEEIRSLVIYMREASQLAREEAEGAEQFQPDNGVFRTSEHAFRLEELVSIDGIIWSFTWLPEGDLLLAEQEGPIWRVRDGEILGAVEGTPEVFARGQGGMLEIALHPDYAENGWIYLAYSDPARRSGEGRVSMTKIVRGKLEGTRWTQEEAIFEAPLETYLPTAHHFGTRLVFQDGYLFFAIGDRGRQDQAQDLRRPDGKVHRIHDDGRVPEDNPFVDDEAAFPTVWTYGNRNPQGLDLHPLTGELWSTEHGPRGGDELNLIRPGINYGWPVITYGMNYNGTPITGITAHPGMEQPVVHWTPSIAVCGIEFYRGDRFPRWQNDLFVTGLASEELRRLVIQGHQVVDQEIVLKHQGRVRDVGTGPDGYLYVSLTSVDRQTGRLVRLAPVD